jgi:hypothetical protein
MKVDVLWRNVLIEKNPMVNFIQRGMSAYNDHNTRPHIIVLVLANSCKVMVEKRQPTTKF